MQKFIFCTLFAYRSNIIKLAVTLAGGGISIGSAGGGRQGFILSGRINIDR